MKTLFVSVLLALFSLLLGQTSYETAMNNAMEKWETATTPDELTAVANQFDRIAAKETDKWEPLYYNILVNSIKGFSLPKDDAFKLLEEIEMDFSQLKTMIDNDETKVLQGMFETIKLAKDPMTYGPTLPQEIMALYQAALKENPNNPRAMSGLAEFNMEGAKYWGQDAAKFCPDMQKALDLFKAEEKDGYKPVWGQSRAEQVYNEKCGE